MASDTELFTAGHGGLVPQGDAARQAVDALRGYAFQVTAAALAWLDIDAQGRLFLEVAEDYTVVARGALEAVQVRDTEISGSITLNTAGVRDAIASFVSLRERNPTADVRLRYLTTSEIGTERSIGDRPGGMAGLAYWRKAATGADVAPLRSILESDGFALPVQEFVKARNDEAVRSDLLRRIHWDCGKPDLAALRLEFEERLVLIGRDVFRLPAPEAKRLADVLIYRVLQRSIATRAEDRVLTRSGLYAAVDEATRIFVPRATADLMTLLAPGLANSLLGHQDTGVHVAVSEPRWIIDGSALPSGRRMVPRTAIESGVTDLIRRRGASFIVGASGLGKSSIAQVVARSLADSFVVAEFRGVDAHETRSRLDTLVSRIGALQARTIILDDLNGFNDSLVASSLAILFEALRRRDLAVIVTCYFAPTATSLFHAGLDPDCRIDCPYFTAEETADLVTLYGGDPKLWGRLAHVAGASGHPQLVHAFVSGMGARGWPASAIGESLARGLSSDDVEAVRDAARRALVSALPENARTLLYRLSLATGRFDRAMALAIAHVPAPVTQAGEGLDALIGPWLEITGRRQYRVSPLAAGSGRDALSPLEQTRIHSQIATQLMAGGTINAGDADSILIHAMGGKNAGVLFILSHSILTADERTLTFLADNLLALRLLRTDGPIFPEHARVSGMLRLAQFKILAAARDFERAGACASALFSEAGRQPDDESGRAFRVVAYAVVLGTMSVAQYVDNWLALLQAFEKATNGDELLSRLRHNFEQGSDRSADVFAVLFTIGTAGLSSVARLERLIGQLDDIDPGRRSHYLLGIKDVVPDWSVFVGGPWTLERQRGVLDAVDAAGRYLRMASTTASWGLRSLTAQCWIARAVMFDEYLNDSGGALDVLDEAVGALGEDVLLSRARARVYWRRQDHSRCLEILREIGDEVARDNPVERANALREAAISAAHCGEWALAETWFLESRQAAAQVELPDMAVMAIGLGTDAAVAALHRGALEQALTGLRDALTALATLDPASSLRALYCHHVVRHAVLWAQSCVERSGIEIDGEPIRVVPGCCSNPEPPQAIAGRPLTPIDVAWYMLAETEMSGGISAGITDRLNVLLVNGPIPPLEISLRTKRLTHDMARMNVSTTFARHLWDYIEARVYATQKKAEIMATFDMRKPARGTVPALPRSDVSLPVVAGLSNDVVLAYCIRAACSHKSEVLADLKATLDTEFGGGLAQAVLSRVSATPDRPRASSSDEALIDEAGWFVRGARPAPEAYCIAGIRFFLYTARSYFRNYLIRTIASWQREAWTRIIVSERFRLSCPERTVPDIAMSLSMADDDEGFLAALLPAVADATSINLPQNLLEHFRLLAAKPAA
ncbi:hypothetical protein VOI32_28320 [Paraburkholderia caribensis]|uniref:Uncharacterized protein n=1 Tax=Paraburkholderia caribensis TaxID=75105 RepID=A0A9Q6S6K4_9BURK|nr:hypothetical protein [Paraburkholderia caribensis]MCO4880124.1 hypothetical protein [Paraburkholderia caribensis]PTB26254.1 hypothetical protein C9I56_23990 [Paraburkholderia caribensis]QLB66127.1 hypothetical protein A9O66_28065 [Paraburkholderia caribensis]